VGIAEKVSKVRGHSSRSYVYKCVNAITAEAYIMTQCGVAAQPICFTALRLCEAVLAMSEMSVRQTGEL